MYNKQRKQMYLDSTISFNAQLKTTLLYTFNDMADTEERLGKDCCDWNAVEILDYLKYRAGRSLESLLVLHSQLGKYAQWCLENNLVIDSQNHYLEIDREVLNDLCINKTVLERAIVTREQLLEVIKDNNIVKNYFEKFLMIAIFEGIGGKAYSDFHELTMDNFEGNTVHLKDRSFEVSDELIEIAKLSSETYEYNPYGDLISNKDFPKDDNRIVKRKEKAIQTVVSYRHWLFTVFERLKNNDHDNPIFNMAMIKESGRLDMIKFYMKEDGLTPEKVVSKYRTELSVRYGNIYAIGRYIDKWKWFFSID